MLNIVELKSTISFCPFSILPIGNHYSEVDVYYFCTCFYTFSAYVCIHKYVVFCVFQTLQNWSRTPMCILQPSFFTQHYFEDLLLAI